MEETKVLENKIIKWNDRLENNLLQIANDSNIRNLLHTQKARKTQKIFNMLSIIGIVTGPLSGIITLINENDHYLNIISIFLSFFSGIMISILKFGKYDEQSRDNQHAAAYYLQLASNIKRQLALYPEDRISTIKYIEWVEKKYEDLTLNSPLINNKLVKNEGKTIQSYTTNHKNSVKKQSTINEKIETTNFDYEFNRFNNV
jgi:hypothetical protein